MTGVMTLDLQFYVTKTDGSQEMACELVLHDTKFGFIAPIDDMTLTIELTKVNVDSVDVVSDTFGKLSAVSIKLEINNGFRIFQGTLNSLLQAHPINFPTEVFGLFKLEQLTLAYYDDYIYAGITPIFLG